MTVPILKRTVFETLTKRILMRTVTFAMRSTRPEPSASSDAPRPIEANEKPNRRALTSASNFTPKR